MLDAHNIIFDILEPEQIGKIKIKSRINTNLIYIKMSGSDYRVIDLLSNVYDSDGLNISKVISNFKNADSYYFETIITKLEEIDLLPDRIDQAISFLNKTNFFINSFYISKNQIGNNSLSKDNAYGTYTLSLGYAPSTYLNAEKKSPICEKFKKAFSYFTKEPRFIKYTESGEFKKAPKLSYNQSILYDEDNFKKSIGNIPNKVVL